jgi:hypothetical protein
MSSDKQSKMKQKTLAKLLKVLAVVADTEAKRYVKKKEKSRLQRQLAANEKLKILKCNIVPPRAQFSIVHELLIFLMITDLSFQKY